MLRGEIGEFTVAEILQMIGLQEKTGMLRIRSRGRSATIFFESGKVVSTRDRRLITKDPFLDYLEQKQVLQPDQSNRVMEIKQSSGGDIVEILNELNLIDKKQLADHLTNYSTETLEAIIKWETGSFEFIPVSDSIPEKKLIKPIRIEPILMEALRRRDEVEEIRRFLPPMDSKIRIAVKEIDELPLEKDERKLLDLVNGERSIEEIVELNQAPEVETLDMLEKFFALGIIAISEEASIQTPQKQTDSRLTYMVALALVVISLIIRSLASGPSQSQFLGNLQAITQFVEDRESENLYSAIECYRYIHGEYPPNLDALVGAGLLSPDGIRNHKGTQYRYDLRHNQNSHRIENQTH